MITCESHFDRHFHYHCHDNHNGGDDCDDEMCQRLNLVLLPPLPLKIRSAVNKGFEQQCHHHQRHLFHHSQHHHNLFISYTF